VVEEATGPSGAIATFDASATDVVDGAVPVVCLPASGSIFPFGDTVVRCAAENAAGMHANARFIVRVRDSVAPTIVSLTPSVSILPPTPRMVPVTLTVLAQDLVDPAPRCMVTRVTSNVRDANHDGVRDWRITGPLTVSLQGATTKHRDRRYAITVRCADGSGNAASAQATVIVSNRR
jgi:hypothetical protein